MWPARATIGRQPSRCVFGTNPWRDFSCLPIPTVFASTRTDCSPTSSMPCWRTGSANGSPLPLRASSSTMHSRSLALREPCEPYSQTAAAVAHVVLEAIEDRLPVWACWKDDKLITGRSYREPHQKPQRRAALLPSELFAINWASSGPGFDWPVQLSSGLDADLRALRRDRIGRLPGRLRLCGFRARTLRPRRQCRAVRHQDHQARLDHAAEECSQERWET